LGDEEPKAPIELGVNREHPSSRAISRTVRREFTLMSHAVWGFFSDVAESR